MIALLLSALVCLSVNAMPAMPLDDSSEFTTNSIVGGTEVNPKFKYPWLTSLQSRGSHFCGGTLLNPTTVVTAAHCSLDTSASSVNVFVHRHDLRSSDEGGFQFTVSKIIVHPQFDADKMANDVAIWKVKLVGQNATALPLASIKLDTGSYSKADTKLTVAGWGTTSSQSQRVSYIMLEATVPITSDTLCKTAYPDVDSTSLCAGYQAGGIDSCQGDSGGPLFSYKSANEFVLVGLTSYGDGCGKPDFPGVYTRVSSSSVSDFIKANQ
jgi:secreted trypsin-like serine protease